MSETIWDSKDVSTSSEFVTFDKPGDSVSGVITAVGLHTFPPSKPGAGDEKTVFKLTLETELGPQILTAGQLQLAKKLKDLRPAVGDGLSVTFTGLAGRMKMFAVEVGKAADAVSEKPF